MSALFGFIHGFVRQILSLLTLLAVILFATPLAAWLKEGSGWIWFQNAPRFVLWGLSSFFIVLFFLGVSGIVALIRKGAGLTRADRWIGCGLGALKGFIFALFVGLGIHLLPEHTHQKFDELHADTNDSYFMKMSRPMLTWNSISAFRSLKDIRDQLRVPEAKALQQREPWAKGSGVDSE